MSTSLHFPSSARGLLLASSSGSRLFFRYSPRLCPEAEGIIVECLGVRYEGIVMTWAHGRGIGEHGGIPGNGRGGVNGLVELNRVGI